MIWYFLLFVFVFAPMIWWLMWIEDFDGMQTEWRMKRRPILTCDEFYDQFYADSGIPKSTIVRLLELTAKQFGVSGGQIRPEDNLVIANLGDSVHYINDIAREFGITRDESAWIHLDGTFDNILRHVECLRVDSGSVEVN